MKWFKFYGQDFLTDPKMLSLTALERSFWLTILCLSSSSDEEGVIKYIDEQKIMLLTNISPVDDEWSENEGFLERFKELGMITIDNENDNVSDNKKSRITIRVNNFNKRQGEAKTAYERVKKHRAKKKRETVRNADETRDDNATFPPSVSTPLQNVIKNEANDNGDNANDNTRVDKIRIDKNIKKENIKEKYNNAYSEYCELIEYWNSCHGKTYKPIDDAFKNFLYWHGEYSLNEMKASVKNIPLHEYWRGKMTPTVFFRRKGKDQQPVDYIGDLLNVHHEEEVAAGGQIPPEAEERWREHVKLQRLLAERDGGKEEYADST